MSNLNEAVDFLKSIKKEDEVVLLYHDDPDGVCGAALIVRALRSKGVELKDTLPSDYPPFITKKIYGELTNLEPDKIISIDVNVDQDLEYLPKLLDRAEMLVIDHHPTINDLSKFDNLTFIKPHFLKIDVDPYRYCSAKLAYDISSQIFDFLNVKWVAVVGMIGDTADQAWSDFTKKVYLKYPKEELLEVARIIHSACSADKSKLALKTLSESDSPTDIKQSKFLLNIHSSVEKDINRIIQDFEENLELDEEKKIMFYILGSKYNILQRVASVISLQKHSNYTIVLFSPKQDYYRVECRNETDRVDMGKLMRDITATIPNATGGGHAPAAGGLIPKDKLNEFKEKVKEYVR